MKRFLILLVPALVWSACTLNRSGLQDDTQAASGDSETNGGSQGSGGDLLTSSTGQGGSSTVGGAQGGTSAQGGSDTTGGMGGKQEGEQCLDNEDCTDAGAVCDPQQAICDRDFQCNAVNICPTGETCFDQAPGEQHGACYTNCTPFASGCSTGETCVDTNGYGQYGACLDAGPAVHGQSCTPHDISTGCVAGYGCYSDAGNNTACLELCNFWGNGTCTTANELCFHWGACSPFGVDSASIGSSCSSSPGTSCGQVGEVATGICTGMPAQCRKICRLGGSDCSEGTCTFLFGNLSACIGS